MSNNISLRSILDANKLTGPNFADWYRNLSIVLRQEKSVYVLERSVSPEPAQDATQDEYNAWLKHYDDNEQAVYVMLGSISSEL